MGNTKKCLYCSEEIQEEAKKCRFCWEWLENTINNEYIGNSINEINKILKYKKISNLFWISWFISLILIFISWSNNLDQITLFLYIISSISILLSFYFYLKFKWRSWFNLLWLLLSLIWVIIIFMLENKNRNLIQIKK